MSIMVKVLSIGATDALLSTRQNILERAGYEVTRARDLREVVAAWERTTFDVVILGHCLPQTERMRIGLTTLYYLKKAKPLELHTSLMPELPEAHGHLQVNASEPGDLVEVVKSLVIGQTRDWTERFPVKRKSNPRPAPPRDNHLEKAAFSTQQS
jgi:CheY-like chemotaxis protein